MVSSRLVSDASRVLADQARAGIVVQRLEERCIDREARHHTRMLNLHV